MNYILIVDDDAVLRKLLKVRLSLGKFNVTEARDGKEALELIGKSVPDAIVTDIDMPVMNGLELLLKVRETHKDLPVIVGSGGWDDERYEIARKANVTETYEKNGALPDIAAMVRKYVQ